jgi:hypothetical protein
MSTAKAMTAIKRKNVMATMIIAIKKVNVMATMNMKKKLTQMIQRTSSLMKALYHLTPLM